MLSRVNIFIRSLIFWLFSTITLPIYSTFILFTFPLSIHARHVFILFYVHFYIYVLDKLCGIHYTVEGLENIPKDRVGIVMSKHQSTWETFFLATLFHSPSFISKRKLGWIPFFGWAMAVSEPIFINRSDKSSAMQQLLTKGKKVLEQNRWIIVFPEGTRTARGTIGHYHSGGARLAVATGYPIIPVAHNAGKCWPRRTFLKLPGTVTMVIGPPIASKDQTPEALLRRTKDWIEQTMVRIDGPGAAV